MNITAKIIILFIIWRIILFVPLYFSPKYIPFNTINKPVELWAYTSKYPPVSSPLVYPWANFDGVHYLTIGEDWYKRDAEGRFFPLYPFLIHIVTFVIGNTTIYGVTEFFAAFAISNLGFLVALIALWRLIKLDYSENIAWWSIVFLLLFPTSFFFVSLYTESLFLLLSVMALYLLRKGNIISAGICGLLLTFTRVVGVSIIIPLAYSYINETKNNLYLSKPEAKKLLPLILIPFGLLSIMLFNHLRWHDFLYFIHAQQAVVNGRSHLIFFIPQTLYRYARILLTVSPQQFEWSIALLEVSSFITVSVLLYKAWKNNMRISYLLFAIGCFLLPTISGTFSGLPRYVSVLFPIYISLALIKNTWLKIGICLVFSTILFLLLMFFSRGYFIA